MAKIGIVADSTCDLTLDEYKKLDVVCLVTPVIIDGETYLDPYEITPPEFYQKLVASDSLPKTSQPSPMTMMNAFQKCADEGCTDILVITISSKLSGTFSSALLVARDSPLPVVVLDSRSVSPGFGQIVIEAVRKRDEGATIEELATYVQAIIDSCHAYCILDTLKYLVKGGRAGRTAGLAASLLNIKPVLEVTDEGDMAPLKKCKGRHRAMNDMAKFVKQYAEKNGPIYYSLVYSSNPTLAYEFNNVLDTIGIEGTKLGIRVVGPAVGTYVAPEGVGISFYQRPDE